MNPKASSILDKVQRERTRGDLKRALVQLAEGIQGCPDEALLYAEGIDLGLEAGESRRAAQFFKTAWKVLPSKRKELWTVALEKTGAYNDAVLAKTLLDAAVEVRDFDAAEDALGALKDHTALELLDRTRTKRQTLRSAVGSGTNFAQEMRNNSLAEAMLCLRTNRFKEASQTLLRVLEQSPEENEVLQPFLLRLEKRDRNNASLSFLIGCSYLISQQWSRGMAHIVQATCIDTTYASETLSRLETLREVAGIPSDEIDLAVARAYLVMGDHSTAVSTLRHAIEKDPQKVANVIGLLEPYVAEVGDDLTLDYLFIDVAMSARRNERALAQIKKIYEARRHRADLLAWLDGKHKEGVLTTDALYYFGEIALAQEMYEKCVEVFRAVVAQSPHEAPRISDLLNRHRGHAATRRFYDELSQSEHVPAEDPTGDGFDIAHFEASEFRFEAKPAAPPPQDTPAEPPPPAPPEPEQHLEDLADDAEDDGFAREGTGFNLGGPVVQDLTDSGFDIEKESGVFKGGEAQPAGDQDLGWLDRTGWKTSRTEPKTEGTQWDTEGIVSQTSSPIQLGGPSEAPAAADAEEPAQSEAVAPVEEQTHSVLDDEPASAMEPYVEAPQKSETEIPVATPSRPSDPERATPVSPEEEYATLVRDFDAGQLKGADTIRLIELASARGDMEAMRRFLRFEPDNVSQEITRKQYVSEYYIRTDQPLSALIVLKTIRLAALGTERRRSVVMAIAYCYRMLHRFDAAQSAYLSLLAEDPGWSDAERMAKVNYSDYLNEMAGRAPVLEKVLTL